MVKGASAVAISVLLEKFVNGNNDYMSTAKFGLATSAGILAGQLVSSSIPSFIPSVKGVYDGKSLLERVVEIGAGAGSGHVFNTYLFKNDYNPSDMPKKLGLIALTDILSEYASDYVNGQPLSYFS